MDGMNGNQRDGVPPEGGMCQAGIRRGLGRGRRRDQGFRPCTPSTDKAAGSTVTETGNGPTRSPSAYAMTPAERAEAERADADREEVADRSETDTDRPRSVSTSGRRT